MRQLLSQRFTNELLILYSWLQLRPIVSLGPRLDVRLIIDQNQAWDKMDYFVLS